MTNLSFASLLTAAGAGIAAGLGRESMPVSGAALAFGLSAVLYLLAGIATGVDSLDAGLVVFVAWLTCATSAVGVHSTLIGGRRCRTSLSATATLAPRAPSPAASPVSSTAGIRRTPGWDGNELGWR